MDGDCAEYLTGNVDFEIEVLTKKKVQSKDKNEDIVYPEKRGKNMMSCMFEVRTPGTLKSKYIGNSNKEDDSIYLKHVMTGDFLFCEEGKRLTLSSFHSKKDPEGFHFYLKMKNSWTSDNSIR